MVSLLYFSGPINYLFVNGVEYRGLQVSEGVYTIDCNWLGIVAPC
jgi:hypothetical protein